ncbi:hypothetical protein [uncultured Mycobacterium sp.]|uniref:hypothetical protein n=1 Tax=uncultured Mycobacterium sp. TaxID=171292 RepID=UPI0035CC016A
MSGLFPRILRVHQRIYEHTDGLLGRRLRFGNPTLLQGPPADAPVCPEPPH